MINHSVKITGQFPYYPISARYEFLENSSLLYKLQFGFRRKHSTEQALLTIVENIKKDLDNKTFVCGVFIDLEKAFDTVNHKILLKKTTTLWNNGRNELLARRLSFKSQTTCDCCRCKFRVYAHHFWCPSRFYYGAIVFSHLHK